VIGNIQRGYTKMTRNAVAAAFLFVFGVLAMSVFANPAEALAAPVVTSAAPSSVSSTGGDSVTIIGTGFESTSVVEINGVSTTSVYVDAQTITFTSVPTVVGAKRVTVVNADGQRFNLESALSFAEVAPTLTGVSPNKGSTLASQPVTLTGANFSVGQRQLTQIATGDNHSCGIYDGAAYCWGLGTSGQLGINSLVTTASPTPVDTSGVLNGKTIKSIYASSNNTCVITTEGQLACWGQNNYGQVGDNTVATALVPKALSPLGLLNDKTILSVDIGQTRICVVASDNNGYCWGRNEAGQFGDGTTTDSRLPVAVSKTGVLNSKSIKQISTSITNTCALATDGVAYCWGGNAAGQVGNGTTAATTVPVAVDTSTVLNGKTIGSLYSASNHSCALSTEGLAYCWGQGSVLGNGSATASTVPVAVTTSGALAGKTLLSISTDTSHTCAVASDNNSYCWGIGGSGRLGNGATATSLAPSAVSRLSGVLAGLSILSLDTGSGHTCAVASNNQSYCWGLNGSYQLGDNTLVDKTTPVASNVMIKASHIVTIGGLTAVSTQFISPTSIVTKPAPNTVGLKSVSITQYDNQVATLANSYEYVAPPSDVSISPASGSVTGGDTITVTGSGFEADSKVRLDDVYLSSINVINNTTITFTAPAQASGMNAEIIVESAYGDQSNSVFYSYLDSGMTITNVSPDNGPITGGGTVAISGTSFTIGMKDISQITAGANFACGVYNGDAYCWGLANRLGSGTAGSTVPVAVTKTGVLAGKTIKQIDAGGNHTCAIASDDQAYCWAINSNGQLGNSSTASGTAPVAVSKAGVFAGKTIKSISAGDSHTCAIASDDKAYCWGLNTSGQLGTGTTTQSTVPVAVATGALTGKTVKSISASSISTCVIASDDQVYCWGTNTSGQLGTGNTNLSYTPIAVVKTGAFAGKTIKSISTGISHACAIASDDLPYCWGDGNVGQLGIGSNSAANVPTAVVTSGVLASKTIKKIDLNGNGSCTVASDNKAYCWGANTAGQLGIGTAVNSNVPVAVSTAGALANRSIRSVSFGVTFACAVTTSNKSFCWGAGTSGQLGNGSTTASNVPNAVTSVISNDPTVTMGGIAATNVQRISNTSLTATIPAHTAGATDTSVSRYDNTTVTAVNSYTYGAAPSISSVSPNKAPKAGGDTITLTGSFFSDVTSVKIGANLATNISIINSTTLTFTAPAASAAGAVDIIIADLYGQTSTLSNGFTYQNAPMTISTLSPTGGPTVGGQTVTFTGTNFIPGFKQLSQVTSGWNHSCGIYEQQAYCWGDNTYGQLGNSSTTRSLVPVAVNTSGVLSGKTIKSISAGSDHTCALASDNLMYCWGDNTYGQLGNSSTTRSLVPVAVNTSGVLSGKTIKSMDVGYINGCAIASDDQAYCWGYNVRGQIGNNSTTQSTVPAAVSTAGVLAGKTIKSIAITLYHTCAIASDDQAYCWGENGGKLGNNSSAQSNVPVAVTTSGVLAGKSIKTIAPGYSHTCALTTDNGAYCWGTGDEGQLGYSSNNSTLVPVAITSSGALAGKTINSLYGAEWDACVITTEGKGYCWGRNTDGQLGNGTTTVSNTPTPIDMSGVLTGKTITSISGSYYHTCAQASDNQAYCWGTNGNGKLGNNSLADSYVPVAVSNVSIPKQMTISIGGSLATNVQILSPTQMTAVTPAHTAGMTNVVATSYDDQVVTKSNAYTYVTPPAASSISPTTGSVSGGDTITISGSGFSGNLKVKINGVYSPSVSVVNDTTLTFVTPVSATPGVYSVVVEDDYGQTSTVSNAFTYRLPDPVLTSISPTAGPMGGSTTITITGTGFVNNPDGATWYRVSVGGVSASNIAYVNSTTLTAVTPAGTIGIKDVAVSSSYTYTVTLANSYTYNAQSYAFTNTALNLSKEEAGTLTITARNASNQPVTSPTATTITLATTSAGGAFARNLTEDIATRWTYTTVVLPAGQSSVNVYYKDTTSGTPTISGTVVGMAPFTQTATISSPYLFTVTGISDPIKAGVPSSVTIRVTDKNGNQRTDYTGTINFTSTDPAATVPASYTMKATDYGIKTFTNGVVMGSVGEYCVSAADSIDGAIANGQQCNITVQAPNSGTISQLAIITPEQRITAGHYSSPITIQAQDTNGISIPVSADKAIFIYSPSATGEFSKDGTTWSGTMPYETFIKAGSSSTNIYFRDSAAHTTTVKAMDNAGESTGGDFGWLNANQSITTGLSPPTKMRITGLQAMVTGQKSNYLVELLDDAGNLVSTDSDVTIRVGSDTSTSLFYFPTTATTGVAGPTEFTIPSGLTGVSIAFSDTTISTSTDFTSLTFTDGRPMTEAVRLQDATKEVQIVTALPTKITLNSILTTMEAGDSTAVDVQLLDNSNQIAPAVETTTIGLSSSTPSGEFSLTQTPFTPVSSVTIAQGQSSKRVYFRDTLAGTSTLSASRAGMTATPDQVEITSSDTASFGITPLTSSTELDTASEAFTVTSYDVFGNVVIQDANLNVYPYSNQTTTRFAASAAGPWNLNPVAILAGQSSVQFFAKDTAFYGSSLLLTASDKSTLDNPDVDIANATAQLSVTGQAVASIAITSSQQTVVAGNVSNKIDIELRKADGSPALQNGRSVSISIADGKFIATNDSTATAITSVTIPQGSATASFYYYGEKSGMQTITATVASTSITTTQPLTVQAAAPNKIVYESPTAPVAPNVPTAAIHAIVRDQFNNSAIFGTDKTITLASSYGTGSFSLSNSNWQNITSINLVAGTSDATFYYKDSTPGDCTLTTTISGITAASQQVSITSYAVDNMVITTPARTIKAGEKTGVITVELREADGSPAVQNGATQLQLSVQSGQFFLNANDTQTISTITIGDGESSGSFYYSGTLAGSRTITVSMAGVATPATQQVTVTPEAPSRLAFTTTTQTVGEGEPSGELHIAIRDQYNNTSPLTSDTTLTFASTCQTGTFSEDAVDWQPVSGINLEAGSIDVTFYYKAMIQGNCSLTVSANGLTSASQNMTITDSNFPIRIGLTVPSTTLTKGENRTLSVSLLDQNGDISAAKVRTTVYMATSSDGTFTQGSVTFAVGESTKTVNYRNNVAGQVTIYARDQNDPVEEIGSLADTSATLNYIDGAAASVQLQSVTTSQTGVLTPVTATLLNAYGVSVEALSDTVVTFTTSNQSGSFFALNGNAATQITVPAGQSDATINYRQTQVGSAAIRGASAGLTASTIGINFVSDGVAEIRFITAPQTLEVGVAGTFRVGLYDEFGNVVVASADMTFYVQSDATSETSGNGQFIISAGQSNALFSYKQNNLGPFSLTVSDTQNGTAGIVDPITHTGTVIAGNPKSFRFTPTNSQLERGGVTDAISVELLNANDQVTAATGSGQVVSLGVLNGAGKYSTTRNGNFTSQLALTVPAGQTSATFYYRNDTAAAGVQTVPGSSVFSATTVTKTGSVTLRYGDPTQLVYVTQPIVVDQYSPSAVLTVQQQNQYGIAVPATGDKTIYLTSNASTGRFGSSKVDWDVSSVIMRNGSSTASFYYQDTVDGQRTITASDTLPVNPDVLLVNATQQLSVVPSSNIPRIVNNFLVTNISDPQAQGTQSSLVLIARDVDGYIVESYDGTVTFSSDDPDAQLPEAYTFIPSRDKGVRVFTNQVAFSTEGEKVVTATDANGITGEQADITVGEGNTNPITALVITQPESPVTIAPNTTSPNITVELRDGAGVSTNAPVGGMDIRVTSTTATGQFATSTAGPWLSTLVTTIPEGIGYANLYYRDSAVGNATITASDWDGAVDSVLIDNASFDVLIHRTYVEGDTTIQTLNALGEYEASAQLFARNGGGAITGKVTNNFSSRNLVNDQLVAVDWRTQWRQGVNLLKSDTATNQTNFAVNIDPIQTTAGASDFYAVAETTETTFADTYGIVSKQLQTMVSPWKSSITTRAYAIENQPIEATLTFRNNNVLASPVTANVFLLSANATDTSNAVNVTGFASPGSVFEYSLQENIALLGGSYKLLAVTYDANGNTTSQVVSEPFTVLETAPIDEIPPVTPVTPTTPNDDNTPAVPGDDTEAPVEPVIPVAPPVVTPVTPTPSEGSEPVVEGTNSNEALVTAGIVATYAATIFVGVFLVRESYKEWARIRRIRSVLKREAQLAKDKDTFLSLASHYLRTPITILDATASMVPAIQGVVATLRTKADMLLENGAASSLTEIVSPDIEKITRSAFKSIYFWLPIIISIALTVAVTILFNTAAAGAELNSALVYTAIIVVAIALIVGFGARTVFINKEVESAKQTMKLHQAQLFNAKTNFIMAMQGDLSNEIGQLKMTLVTNVNIPGNVRAIIQDATGRLEQLVSKLAIAAQINGMAAQTETFTPQALVQSSVQRLQTTIQEKKLVVVEQYDENAPVAQDQRLLRYVTGTVLDNAVMFSKPGSIIDIDTSKHGKATRVSITNEDSSFGSVEKLTAMFEPFNHATHENDLTVEGMGLSLYLDKLIMEHLGGTISASSSALHHNASINITFPSVK